VVEWELQFIALQRAEPIRTDFGPGEPFMLTRGPAGEGGFVYVAVPAELVPEVERIQPLGRIRVRARVRNAHSPLTEAPILELLELRRAGDADGRPGRGPEAQRAGPLSHERRGQTERKSTGLNPTPLRISY